MKLNLSHNHPIKPGDAILQARENLRFNEISSLQPRTSSNNFSPWCPILQLEFHKHANFSQPKPALHSPIMAFITSSSRLPQTRKNARRAVSRHPKQYTIHATATAPGLPSVPRYQPPSKPHKKASAHIVDSRVSTRVEAHHWIVIKNHSMRLFEQAAVAQADITRQVESRSKRGALHRWVLRQVEDPTEGAMDVALSDKGARYVVMEAFNRQGNQVQEEPMMRRWLSAVERAGPLVNALDIRTMKYENMFTSKLHGAKFDPNSNIVVMESLNVDMSKKSNFDNAVRTLREAAETSVTSGDSLEFCVLHAPGEKGFFKTIEVYKDIESLKRHMRGKDKYYAKTLERYITHGHRNRQTFKPVVFS